MKIKRFNQLNENNRPTINEPEFSTIDVENMFYELKDDYDIDFKVDHCYYGPNKGIWSKKDVITSEDSADLTHAYRITFKLKYEMTDSVRFFDVDFMEYIIKLCKDKGMEFKFGISDNTCHILLILNKAEGESNRNGVDAASEFYNYMGDLEGDKYKARGKDLFSVSTSQGSNNVYIRLQDLSTNGVYAKGLAVIKSIFDVTKERNDLDGSIAMDLDIRTKLQEICDKYNVKATSKSDLNNDNISIYFVD